MAAVANPVVVANHQQPAVAAFATHPAVVPRDWLAAEIEAERAILLELLGAFRAAAFQAAYHPVAEAFPVAASLVVSFPAAVAKRVVVAFPAERAAQTRGLAPAE